MKSPFFVGEVTTFLWFSYDFPRHLRFPSPRPEAKTFEFGELRAQRKAVHLPFREPFASLPLQLVGKSMGKLTETYGGMAGMAMVVEIMVEMAVEWYGG